MTWSMQVPVLSTGHISRDTSLLLEVNPAALHGIVTCAPYSSGWFLLFHTEVEPDQADLRAIREWVFQQGPDRWCRLDQDGDMVDGLPGYDW